MQSEAKREVAEIDLRSKTEEHRKALSDLAKAKIKIAQLEAHVAAFQENGATIDPLSLNKINNIVATDFGENTSDYQEDNSRSYSEAYFGAQDIGSTESFSNPNSWIRNYVSTDIDYAAGRPPDLTTVPPSIAEVNRHKSGENLSENGVRSLKTTLARLGRDTTLSVS